MSFSPLFSVVIPTYHRNESLARCLDCLAPRVQSLPAHQYEVIVSDDGFEATSQEMIRDRYPWAKWIAGPRKGPAANRNNGAKYARGEWLVFTDDDCLPDKNWLQAFAKAIELNIDVYEGKTTCEAGIHSPLEHAPINLTGGYLWSCNMMVKAFLFQKIRGFDEAFLYPHLEDSELRERIKMANCLSVFVENAVVDHPARKLPSGQELGASQESLVMYWRRIEKKQFFKLDLLIIIIKFRLNSIIKFPVSFNSFLACISLINELFFVIGKLNKWDKKYPLSQ